MAKVTYMIGITVEEDHENPKNNAEQQEINEIGEYLAQIIYETLDNGENYLKTQCIGVKIE